MQKIDFVILWTDGDNEEWNTIRNKYIPKKIDEDDSHSSARFRDMGTLKYVLRSIEKNCPWFNKIFLITKGYYPEWLDINHSKIILIDENTLFKDQSCLPIFNSIAIEMNLHNIPDLSERFVYLNDDMVIIKPLKPERFFKENKAVDFLSHSALARNDIFDFFKKRDTWIHSINNSLNLINQHFHPIKLSNEQLYHSSYTILDKINNFLFDKLFQKFIWIQHWHHPQPHLKKTLMESHQSFFKEMEQCSRSRFRNISDLNPYIYRYHQLASGDFYPHKYNDALISNLDSISVLQKLIKKLEKDKSFNFVCFNDSTKLSDTEYNIVRQILLTFLKKKFPEKASFEI